MKSAAPQFEKLAELAAAEAARGYVEPELDPYMPHAAFARQRDEHGRTRYEDPTDCEGMLRIEDQSRPIWVMVCDACGFTVGVNLMSSDPEKLLAYRLGRSGLPEAFRGKEFDSTTPAQAQTLGMCRQWVSEFRPTKPSAALPAIALWGQVGRGKTHLLCLMVETLIRRHMIDASYRSASQFFDELQAGIDTGAYEVAWERFLNVGVLALDDLGAGARTEWRQDRLAALVDHRYSKELPLLVATNVPPSQWEERFGDRTASRLKGLCLPARLEGPDRRSQGVQETMLEHVG